VKLAYLNSEYPSLSHTFIEREVRELREFGFEIATYSARPTDATGRLGTAHAAEARSTTVLQTGRLRLLADTLHAIVFSPLGTARAVLTGQRLSPPGLPYRVRHLAYAVQALRLARHAVANGHRHVHVHMGNNGAAIAMLACTFDRRLSYSLTIHGSEEFFHIDSWRIAAKAQAARFVRCISHSGVAQVMAWTPPEAWGRFHVVHCGIYPEQFTPRPPRAPGPLRLVSLGRLHVIKGYELLLEACAMLRTRGAKFTLTMLGSGPDHDRLASRIAQLGLGDTVRLVGPIAPELVPAELDSADAMVLSSFMEGVPIVLMEAMAKELGVIATRVGGIPELVHDGVSGLLVNPASAESLAAAIHAYASDPSLCRTHGKAGRAHVLAEFDIRTTAARMADLFRNYRVADSAPADGDKPR
jgi:glycosyltransferase involved in cell wall biosynthesis